MSAPDEELYIQLMLSEPSIAKLTEAAVGKALEGFALVPQRDIAWLARAIQGALFVSLGNASDGPERQSDAATRDELLKLGTRASKLWLAIQQRSSEADRAAWDYGFRNWRGEGLLSADMQADWSRFNAALAELDWLSSFLRIAANAVLPQGQKWRDSERRELRILRAQCLSPIYETAFGVEPTVNTWPGQNGGPWPDFYQRIVKLAFGVAATPNWESVLDEARRRDKAGRVQFAEGIIPQ